MNNSPPVCSVCIANYNGVGLLKVCIDAVLAQGWGSRVEIIVHDDASTDGSAAWLREHYPALHIIESNENVGFCIANNRMARAARGEFLLLLNNDATLLPGALDTLLATARQLGRPAILSLPQYDAETGRLLDIGSLLDPFFNPVPNRDPTRNEVGMVMGACLWLPKTLWDTLGGFPEWFGSIGEDLYLCCAARLRGIPVYVPNNSGYRHCVGRSFGGGKVLANRLSTTRRRRALSERNKTRVMLLCCPGELLWALLPMHLLLLAVEGLLVSLTRGLSLWHEIYLPTLREALNGLNWQQRKRLQAQRNMTWRAWLRVFDWRPYKLHMLLRHGLPEIRP